MAARIHEQHVCQAPHPPRRSLSTASVPGLGLPRTVNPVSPEGIAPIPRHVRFRQAKRATLCSSPNKLLRSLGLLWWLLVWVGRSLAQQATLRGGFTHANVPSCASTRPRQGRALRWLGCHRRRLARRRRPSESIENSKVIEKGVVECGADPIEHPPSSSSGEPPGSVGSVGSVGSGVRASMAAGSTSSRQMDSRSTTCPDAS